MRKALIKAISDTSDIVRQRALIAALDLADPTIVSEVVKALKDNEDEVRITAAEVLAWYQQPSTIPNFLDRFEEGRNVSRAEAAAMAVLLYLAEKVGRGYGEKSWYNYIRERSRRNDILEC